MEEGGRKGGQDEGDSRSRGQRDSLGDMRSGDHASGTEEQSQGSKHESNHSMRAAHEIPHRRDSRAREGKQYGRCQNQVRCKYLPQAKIDEGRRHGDHRQIC